MTDPAISLRGLTKHYGSLVALSNLTVDVARGEIFGFLGLNGAGKTTTIRLLLDLIRPTAGEASVFGRSCQHDGLAVRAQIGYLAGDLDFYHDMTGEQVLRLLARLSAQPADPVYLEHLKERFEVSTADLGRRLREYSSGMKRKLGLLQAFQTAPPLLILDEPTEGLDPAMQERFYELLAEVKAQGRTVFLSSQVLPEVERVCDRIAVIRTGRLSLLATAAEIRDLAPRKVRVTFARDVRFETSFLPPLVGVTDVQPREWTLTAYGPLGALLTALASWPVLDLEVREPRVEDIVPGYCRNTP